MFPNLHNFIPSLNTRKIMATLIYAVTPAGKHKIVIEFPIYGATAENPGFKPEPITLEVADGEDCLQVVRNYLETKTPFRFSERIFIRLHTDYRNSHCPTVELESSTGPKTTSFFSAATSGGIVPGPNTNGAFVYDLLSHAARKNGFALDNDSCAVRYVHKGYAAVRFWPLSQFEPQVAQAPKEVVKEVIKEVVKEVVKEDPTAVKIKNEDLRKTIASFVEWYDKTIYSSPSNVLSTNSPPGETFGWLVTKLSDFVTQPEDENVANNIIRIMLGLQHYTRARVKTAKK